MRNFGLQKNLPGTAAPPPALYNPIYQRILDAGDTVLVLTPPVKMSGTFRSATVAADDFDTDRINIVDTQTIAGNLGTIVLKAKEWADEGMGIEELIDRVKDMSARDRKLFLVPTLEYLHKGGRIGGASKLIGSLLQIVPILTLRDGGIEVYDKVRTINQAINEMVDLTVQICENNPEANLSIGQCDSKELFEKSTNLFRTRLDQEEFPSFTAPPAIVVHAGPGLVVTSCFAKPRG